MSRFSWSETPRTSVAWRSQVLPTMMTCCGFRIAQGVEADVVLRLDAFAARHAEGDELRVLELHGFGFGEEGGVFGIGKRIAAFDEVDAEVVEFVGDKNFILDGEGDAFALRAVARAWCRRFLCVRVSQW